jgi:hypothetical protein
VVLTLGLQFHSRVPPHVLGESDSSATHLLSGKQFLSGFSTYLLWCPENSFTLQVLNSFALEFRKQFHSLGSQLICFGVQKMVSLFRFSTHLHWSSESSSTLWVLNSFALVSSKQFHSSGSQLICIRVQKTDSIFGFSIRLLWSSENSYNSSGSQLICFGLQKTSFIL